MTDQENPDLFAQLGGTPEEVAADLIEYSEMARILSDEQENLIGKYPLHWVCLHKGRVSASSRTLPALMGELKEQGIPAGEVIVRFIDKNQNTFIL